MTKIKCVVCIRDNERRFLIRAGKKMNKEKEQNCLIRGIIASNEAITITRGFAVCEEHIKIVWGCYAFK